jgi:integrase
MPKIKLTQRVVDKLAAPDPSGKQVLFFDVDMPGFAVLVSGVSRTKTYVAQGAVNKRTRRVTISRCDLISLEEAKRDAAAVLLEMHRGHDPKERRRSEATLRQALDDYVAARKNLRPKTISIYRGHVTRHLGDWLDLPLRSITVEMVEARHRQVAAEIESRGHYQGKITANDSLRCFRAVWNWSADRVPDLGPCPVRMLKRSWYPMRRRTGHVRADELPQFYRAVTELEDPIARDLILLLLFTGMRLGEASSLEWDAVDFAAKVIRVPAMRMKAGKQLDLPMTDVVRDLLVARRRLGKTRFVFVSDGMTGHVTNLKPSFDAIAAATGIAVSSHDLRRTWISIAETCAISSFALRALIAHSLGGGVTEGYMMMMSLGEQAQLVTDRIKELTGIEGGWSVVTTKKEKF